MELCDDLKEKRNNLMKILDLNYSAGCHFIRGFDAAVEMIEEKEERLKKEEAEYYAKEGCLISPV